MSPEPADARTMLVALVNGDRRLEGGLDTYLDKVILALHWEGHPYLPVKT
jgi:hypothetical protein